MISFATEGRIRLSRRASEKAGFQPGQKIAVVSEGRNSFRISPVSRKVTAPFAEYSVEKDGRIRLNRAVVRTLGVRSSRKAPKIDVSRGSIVVTM